MKNKEMTVESKKSLGLTLNPNKRRYAIFAGVVGLAWAAFVLAANAQNAPNDEEHVNRCRAAIWQCVSGGAEVFPQQK